MGSNYREIALLSLTGSANSRVLDSVWILCNLQPREDVERAYCTLTPPCRGLGPGGVKTHWINLYFHKNASFTDYSASDSQSVSSLTANQVTCTATQTCCCFSQRSSSWTANISRTFQPRTGSDTAAVCDTVC